MSGQMITKVIEAKIRCEEKIVLMYLADGADDVDGEGIDGPAFDHIPGVEYIARWCGLAAPKWRGRRAWPCFWRERPFGSRGAPMARSCPVRRASFSTPLRRSLPSPRRQACPLRFTIHASRKMLLRLNVENQTMFNQFEAMFVSNDSL